MATTLALDDKLIVLVQELGNHPSKKDAVNAALREYIQHREQLKILRSFGKIPFSKTYDYKRRRARK